MLRFVILIGVFFLAFFFIYRKMKKSLFFWSNELSSDDKFNDRADKLKIEGDKLHEDLNEKSKQLEKEAKEIKNLKKKGF